MPELPVSRRSPDLDRIWVGMPVIDSDGRTIGAVRNVCLDETAEPGAAKQTVADDLAGGFARALAEGPSCVPASRAEDLARRGFLKVSGLGPFDHDLYVAAAQIAQAGEEEVRLTAALCELAADRENWA